MYQGDFTATETGAVEAPVDPDTFGFHGQVFTLRDRVGLMTLMRYAAVAKQGVKVDALEGLVAMYELLEDCIVPDDWSRFERLCRDETVGEDELLSVVKRVLQTVARRPTGPPSDSPGGPTTTSTSTRDDSSSPVPGPLDGMVPVGVL